MKNIEPQNIENKPIGQRGPELPLKADSAEVKVIFSGENYYLVEYVVQKKESVRVYCTMDDKFNWYWIKKRRGCIPESREEGPFDTKEAALLNIKHLFTEERYPVGYAALLVDTERASLK